MQLIWFCSSVFFFNKVKRGVTTEKLEYVIAVLVTIESSLAQTIKWETLFTQQYSSEKD